MAVVESARALPATPWGFLPARMRALHVGTPRGLGSWLADAFASDSASDVHLERAVGVTAGLPRLRNEVFDALLVSHQPGELDALELVEGIRAGSPDLAVIVLGAQSEQEMAALCYEVGADAYVCVNTTTTRALIWTVARAMERHRLIAENRRLQHAERHRLQQEQKEVERLLAEQRQVVCGRRDETNEIDAARPNSPAAAADKMLELPERLVAHYRELLRAYVIMGSGNLVEEMNTLAELLATAGITAQQTMLLHLNVVGELTGGLGNRSARHVLNRADLLVIEVLVHLAEQYHGRYFDRLHPPRQLTLAGMDEA